MDETQKIRMEQIALVCTKSLINIAKDLKSIEAPVMADLCLFIAKQITNKADPDGKVVHTHEPGGARTHTTIKKEIEGMIATVKSSGEFADDK